jgi:hypothetical protein
MTATALAALGIGGVIGLRSRPPAPPPPPPIVVAAPPIPTPPPAPAPVAAPLRPARSKAKPRIKRVRPVDAPADPFGEDP